MSFLNGKVCNGVPIPPLEVAIDPMVGSYERTLIVEPLHDPVPPPETVAIEATR